MWFFCCRKVTFSRISSGCFIHNKGDYIFQNVVRRAHQCPLAAHLFNSTQQKLSEAPRPFDLSKDRFHNALARCIYGRSRLRSGACASFCHPRSTLRSGTTLAELRLMSVFLSACRYINVHRFCSIYSRFRSEQ